LCTGVVVVGLLLVAAAGVVVAEEEEEELPPLLPHPATARALARMAAVVSMAVSGVLLMGRAPIIARGLGRSRYQAFAALADPGRSVAARIRHHQSTTIHQLFLDEPLGKPS